MLKKVKLGIVGLGGVGNIHLNSSLQLSNATVEAVSDVSKKALALARMSGVKKTYPDYEQLLADKELDAVIIALPNHLHLQCATKAAEQKKHILLEKPIARNVSEAEEIVTACQRNSVKLMMGYVLRFYPIFRELKEKIDSGSLGDIEGAYATNIGSGPFSERVEAGAPVPVPEWWFNKTLTGGGVLMDLGSHLIDLLRWYFGEITDIRSHLRYRFNMDFEDSATCLAKFSSGTTALMRSGWFSLVTQKRVELLGTAAHAEAQELDTSGFILNTVQRLLTGNSSNQSPYFTEINYFVNCLLHDSNPSPSVIDGLKDIEAVSLAYKNEIQLL